MRIFSSPLTKILLLSLFILMIFTGGCLHAGCSSDPDHYLLFDTLSLVEDYYIEAPDKKAMLEQSVQGFALELAARKMKQEQEEKEKEEKAATENQDPAVDKSAKDEEGDNKTPDEKNQADSVDPKKSMDEKTEPDEEEIVESIYDPEKQIAKMLEKAPFTFSSDENKITVNVNDSNLEIPYVARKQEMVDSFFKGYEFVRTGLNIPPEDKDLFYAGIDGMIHSLDPHSSFLSPSVCTKLREETTGSFAGVGIEIGMRSNMLTVIQPIVGTPAFKAGIKPLDRITAIDGESTMGISLMEAVEQIRGKIDTTVTLTVQRVNVEKPLSFELVRAKIDETSIKETLLPDKIGHVRVFKFNEKTRYDLDEAMTRLETEAGGKLNGLILDLRDNPGGLLDQAVFVADKFLDEGMIVDTVGRGMFEKNQRFATHRSTEKDLPLLVLVNIRSASGAEIVAGALQDHHRALLIGSRTFGKGSVQSIFKLPENACLRLTTARYFTPSGRSIQATGIVPDITFRYPDDEERILASFTEKALPGRLTSNKADPNATAEYNFQVERIFDYYEKTKQVVIDDDFPEKSDWLLVFAKKLFKSKDLSPNGMLTTALEQLKVIPELPAKPEPEKVTEAKTEKSGN